MSDISPFDNSHYYALPVGTDLFEFRIEQVLGHGGFGITYLATDTHLDERVAIKEYMPNEIAVRVSDSTVRAKSKADSQNLEQGLNAFLEEARTLARFRHPNIVHVRRFFKLHGTAYIVLEYEHGQTLSTYLETHKMENSRLRDFILGVLDGLDAVHQRATLHRDLKPSNIILRPDESPVLIDFGAARDFQSRNSVSVTAIATAGYSPPEQYIGGQQGPWTDLYALGAIAYRIVSGNTPPDSLRRLRNDPLIPASSLDVDYDPSILRTIDWMLKIDESERPISVEVVRNSLGGSIFEDGENIVGSTATGSQQNPGSSSDRQPRTYNASATSTSLPPKEGSRQVWTGIASLTVLVLIGILGLAYYKDAAQQKQISTTIRSPVTAAPLAVTTPPSVATVPTATTTPSLSWDKLAEARYDQQKLNALLDQCKLAGACTPGMTAAINDRLQTAERERQQYWAARTAAEYSAYLTGCVACNFRETAQTQMKNLATPPVVQPPKPERWNAVAYVTYRINGRSRVSAGYSGIRSSPEEAKRSAKAACERNSDGRECYTSTASNSGCYYIQTGTKRNGVRWASGASSESAQSRCQIGGYRCGGSPIGGCID